MSFIRLLTQLLPLMWEVWNYFKRARNEARLQKAAESAKRTKDTSDLES